MRIYRKISNLMCMASVLISGLAHADQSLFMVPNGVSPDAQPYAGKTYIFSARNAEAVPLLLGLVSENQQGEITRVEHEHLSKTFLDQPPFEVDVTVVPGKPASQSLLLQSTADAPVQTGQYEYGRPLISLDVISFLVDDPEWQYRGGGSETP